MFDTIFVRSFQFKWNKLISNTEPSIHLIISVLTGILIHPGYFLSSSDFSWSLFFDNLGTKQQEIVVSRGKILELLRPDPNTGKVHTLLTVEVFGVIRSLMAFRLTGGTKDYIVVGSDSGRIVILEYQPSKNMFEKIHQETFGKSGCRRIVPGQFLAVDPKGRAVMISEWLALLNASLTIIDAQFRVTMLWSLQCANKS